MAEQTGSAPAWSYPPPPKAEPAWPSQVTVLAVVGLQLSLPDRLTPGGVHLLLPVLEGIPGIVLLLWSPRRLEGQHRGRRRLAISVIAFVSFVNAIALGLLVHYLVASHKPVGGHELIVAGMIIWLTNWLLFGVWFWELDRGGPGRRAAGEDQDPDFLFPQMTDDRIEPRGWRPAFIDYLYVSLTNATAFSPTDTLPLSPMAKSIMGLEGVLSLVTIGLIISRAVNIL